MTPTEHHCKNCGGSPDDDSRFDCPTCARPLGVCPDCASLVRLFDSGDPRDCEDCEAEHAPRTPEEEERLRLVSERLMLGLRRQLEASQQMREHSGPIYDQSRQLGRVVADAYRAAGRPRRVVKLWRGGYAHPVRTGPFHADLDPATEDEWKAWEAWVEERNRLRRELGVNR
jgi:hypothetical protein